MDFDQNVEIVDKVELSEKEQKARRSRNKAIAWSLVALVVIFWAATVFKIGANLAQIDRGL